MANARNIVLDGSFKGKKIKEQKGTAIIVQGGFKKDIRLDSSNVTAYEIVTEEQMKSAASGIARGMVGAAFLGPVGALAGLTASKKGIYRIMMKLKDGSQLLIEVDEILYGCITDKLALMKFNEPAPAPVAPTPTPAPAQTGASNFSVADEILKYKQLLDMGVISEAEFETKKNQLLNM